MFYLSLVYKGKKQKRKSFVPEKIRFKPKVNWLQYQNKPALFTVLIFIDGFDYPINRFVIFWPSKRGLENLSKKLKHTCQEGTIGVDTD